MVDDEDADLLKSVSRLRSPDKKIAHMVALRFLGPTPEGHHIDHINNKFWDNRRNNLQFLPALENVRKHGRDDRSKYVGVGRHKRNGKYKPGFLAFGRGHGKTKYLGTYFTEEDAAHAVDNWYISIGLKPRNLPDDIRTNLVRRGNLGSLTKRNKSGYISVSLHKKTNTYRSRLTVNTKSVHLGYYSTAIDAAKAYDKYIIDHQLSRPLNFPEDYGL